MTLLKIRSVHVENIGGLFTAWLRFIKMVEIYRF